MDLLQYKYVVVGSGFFGSVIAERIANDLGDRVLIIEKRDHIGGNCFSDIDKETGIEYHKYGTHIFHTSNKVVWDYINRFTEFNSYFHQVLTTHKGKVYQMPINLETINSFYNVNLKPFEVDGFLKKIIKKENNKETDSFEGKAISWIGKDLYEAFIKGYTQKQWQIDPKELPASILKRLPFRKNYNESYYYSRWQGIPLHGYTKIFEKLLANKKIDIILNQDFFDIKSSLNKESTIIYSGHIDKLFDYKFGKLEWRTLSFEKEIKEVEDYQGTSVMNYADIEIPYTRIHEPRHLHPERDLDISKTIIIKEYSEKDFGENPYYPINNTQNIELLNRYIELAKNYSNYYIGGRLGDYRYYDMHDAINAALETYSKIKSNNKT